MLQFDIHQWTYVSAAAPERDDRRDLATNNLKNTKGIIKTNYFLLHFNNTSPDFMLQICFQASLPKFLEYAPIIQYIVQCWTRTIHLVRNNVLNPDVSEDISSFNVLNFASRFWENFHSLEISEFVSMASLMFFIILIMSPTKSCSELP